MGLYFLLLHFSKTMIKKLIEETRKKSTTLTKWKQEMGIRGDKIRTQLIIKLRRNTIG